MGCVFLRYYKKQIITKSEMVVYPAAMQVFL
jgi:hypothetical protein